MSFPLSAPNNAKIGTCPHGLPPGACPICSGAGGGGAKKADFSAKPGEMSWAECAAIGQMMKAQKMARQANEQAFQAQLATSANFEKNIANLAQKIADFAVNFQKNAPAIIAKPISIIANNILVPMLNRIAALSGKIQNLAQALGEKLTDISDKLNAMFGELKNSIEKKISDAFKNTKKKFLALFGVVDTQNADDEEEKINESKKIFEMKTFIHNLKEKFTKNDETEINDTN